MQAEKIVSVKKFGIIKTVDLEVNHPAHVYYGDGMVIANSHSLSYGIIGYQCAYAKTHFPHISFTSWLRDVKNRPKPFEEVQSLVTDAQSFGIEVYPPTIIDKKINFYTDGKIIKFGLSNMKGVGERRVEELIKFTNDLETQLKKPINEWTWYEFLCLMGSKIPKSVMEPLIACGGLRELKKVGNRATMMEEYKAYCELTIKELEWVDKNYSYYDNIISLLNGLAKPKPSGGCFNEKRMGIIKSLKGLLEKPITPLRDDINKIADDEENYLGIELTCSKADAIPGQRHNCTCKDISNGNIPRYAVLKVKVDNLQERTIKRGKEENIGRTMASLRLSDGTGALEDLPCFPDQWDEYKHLLTPGRVVELQLEKPFYKKSGPSIKKVWSI